MDAAMLETSRSIPTLPAAAEHARLPRCFMGDVGAGSLRLRSTMDACGENPRGCGDEPATDEDRDSDTDFEPSKLGTKD